MPVGPRELAGDRFPNRRILDMLTKTTVPSSLLFEHRDAEHLAYTVKFKGEANLPEIWPEPLQLIVRTLPEYHKYNDVLNNLPDICLIL